MGVFTEEEEEDIGTDYLTDSTSTSFSQILLHCHIKALKWDIIISCFTDKGADLEVTCPRLHSLQEEAEIRV